VQTVSVSTVMTRNKATKQAYYARQP